MRVVLYGVDTAPLGRVLGDVIARGDDTAAAAIGTLSAADAVTPFVSFKVTVNVLVPELVGVPERTPDWLKVRLVLHTPEQFVTAQV